MHILNELEEVKTLLAHLRKCGIKKKDFCREAGICTATLWRVLGGKDKKESTMQKIRRTGRRLLDEVEKKV